MRSRSACVTRACFHLVAVKGVNTRKRLHRRESTKPLCSCQCLKECILCASTSERNSNKGVASCIVSRLCCCRRSHRLNPFSILFVIHYICYFVFEYPISSFTFFLFSYASLLRTGSFLFYTLSLVLCNAC